MRTKHRVATLNSIPPRMQVDSDSTQATRIAQVKFSHETTCEYICARVAVPVRQSAAEATLSYRLILCERVPVHSTWHQRRGRAAPALHSRQATLAGASMCPKENMCPKTFSPESITRCASRDSEARQFRHSSHTTVPVQAHTAADGHFVCASTVGSVLPNVPFYTSLRPSASEMRRLPRR
jgi:hypothetical protein